MYVNGILYTLMQLLFGGQYPGPNWDARLLLKLYSCHHVVATKAMVANLAHVCWMRVCKHLGVSQGKHILEPLDGFDPTI